MPIVVAAGVDLVVMFVLAMAELLTVNSLYGYRTHFLALVMFLSGVASFAFAMILDASDRLRATYRSDVAFWLHLLSAPLIVYPIVDSLGVLDTIHGPFSTPLVGEVRMYVMIFILFLYLALIILSIVIDRRAFIISSLFYVLIALGDLMQLSGDSNGGIFLSGIIIGLALLFISAFWTVVRAKIMGFSPLWISCHVPPL